MIGAKYRLQTEALLLALALMPLNRLARAFLFACLRSPIAHFELLLLPNSHLLDVIRM
jgi:hypothetical protein